MNNLVGNPKQLLYFTINTLNVIANLNLSRINGDIILNEDGTQYDEPKNPLGDKWFPLIEDTLLGSCDITECSSCDKCPFGDEWIIPEEDIGTWNQYLSDLLNYQKIHNPSLYEYLIQHQDEIIGKEASSID